MKIYFDNVNLNSRSGPNSFGKKLRNSLNKNGHTIKVSPVTNKDHFDVQLSFISSTNKVAPIVQRLDGIYFNSAQNFNSLNAPIKATYDNASAVIFQSEFNKKLTEQYFGAKDQDSSFVIHNGTSLSEIELIKPIENENLDKFSSVWCCASSWRPHKRLKENINYFLEHADSDACFVIAGANPDAQLSHPRVFYAGDCTWENLISLYKRSTTFVHLAWLDHCPNVVVDARASGCKIVCSSTGGTKEIAGKNSIIIEEDIWDFSPLQLYSPPKIDFSNILSCEKIESEIDIHNVSSMYLDVFNRVVK
tara:strand:- start:2171 stop:3088 length:918 start_codon:yes stop_codon:yes gene_type:complete